MKRIYVNWWGGLGDCILYLSVIHSHKKHFGEQLNFGASSLAIEKKQAELLNVFKSDLVQTPRTEFTKDGSGTDGKEDWGRFDIVPNDNYDYNYSERGWLISNQIVGTSRVLRLDKAAKWMDIPLEYLPYQGPGQRKQVTVQIGGGTVGSLDKYMFDMDALISVAKLIRDAGLDAICVGQAPGDQLKALNGIASHAQCDRLADYFSIVSQSICHVGIDSGMAHVALSCGVPVVTIRKRTWLEHGLGLRWNDSVLVLDKTRDFMADMKSALNQCIREYESTGRVARRIATDPRYAAINIDHVRKCNDIILGHLSENFGI